MSIPLSANDLLDREFLGVRARLIDVAAALDRLDRAEGSVSDDPRRKQIRQAVEALAADEFGRAEKLQLVFSLPYEEDWQKEA